jgi:hypothetical protein
VSIEVGAARPQVSASAQVRIGGKVYLAELLSAARVRVWEVAANRRVTDPNEEMAVVLALAISALQKKEGGVVQTQAQA